jgi:hypothetical protein
MGSYPRKSPGFRARHGHSATAPIALDRIRLLRRQLPLAAPAAGA